MAQWSGFDYTSPYYYLVTLKARAGLEAFSILTEENERGVKNTPITRKMNAVIF